MPKLQLTTEEANSILNCLYPEHQALIAYIKDETERYIPTIMGLPTKEQLSDEGVECLDKWRNPYIAYFTEGEDEPYAIFESLGEDAGSDDDPIKEFATYEEMQTWWENYNIDGILP